MLAGTSARVLFTHLSQRSCTSLQEKLSSFGGPGASSQVYTQSILELLKNQDVPLSKVCLLDPRAQHKLEPEDGLEFEWFLFGARRIFDYSILLLPINLVPVLGNPGYSSSSSSKRELLNLLRRRSASRSHIATPPTRISDASPWTRADDDRHRTGCYKTSCG